MRSIILAGLLCLICIATHTTQADAQISQINVTATVLSPLNVSSITHLDLGYVLAGGGEQGVLAADPEAGTLTISKSDLNGLTLDVSYPTELIGPAGATLPLLYNNSIYGNYTPDGGSTVSFNPANPGTDLEDILETDTGAVFRFGASVDPPLGQTVGAYSAQIVLTISYAALV